MVNLVKTDEWHGRDLDSNRAVGEEAIKILDSIGMTTVDQAKVLYGYQPLSTATTLITKISAIIFSSNTTEPNLL